MCNFPNRYVLAETLEGKKTYILAEAPIDPSGVGIEPSGWYDSNLSFEPIEPTGSLTQEGWRPIETAPRDGRVLGVVDGDVRVIAYGKTSHVPMYGWCLADQGSAEEFDLCCPTHWQPLPPPPLT